MTNARSKPGFRGTAGPVRLSLRFPAAIVGILLFLPACNPAEAPAEDSLAYQSVWAELYPDSLQRDLGEGTLQGAFFSAASAGSQAAAEERWAEFLSVWTPPNGEYEDGMQATLVTWAELEMQRLEHLKHDERSAAEAVGNKLRELAADFE